MRNSLRCFLAFATIALIDGDNFRYGTFRWTSCDIFADPLFPDVCAVKGSRKFGFTISASWDQQNSAQSMLSNSAAAISNFQNGQCANNGCALLVTRRCSSASCIFTNERRIGYRSGFVESAPPYNDRSVPVTAGGANAGIGDASQGAGIINCPVPSTCLGDFTTPNYVFQIERLARGLIYARFSFELTFSMDGNWIVFFEGCCRLPSCSNGVCESNGVVTGIVNNAGLPFHIRTGVLVGSDPALPAASFRFEMPDLVMLRWNGVPSPDVCTVTALAANTLSFSLQGFHPDLRFADRVRFRVGTVYEQGLYKCVEHSPVLNPNGPLYRVDVALKTLAQRCPVGGSYPVLFSSTGLPLNLDIAGALSGGAYSYFTNPGPVQRTPALSVDPVSGLVTFPVANTGVWQATLVADVCLCPGGCGGCQSTVSVPVDFLIQVRDAQNNPHPPMPDYASFLYLNQQPVGLSGVALTAPQTAPLFPAAGSGYAGRNPYLAVNSSFYIKIQCGTGRFFREAMAERGVSLPAYSQPFLRVGYRDYDDRSVGAFAGCDGTIVSFIDFIEPANALPPGALVGATVQGSAAAGAAAGSASQDSRAYIDITWSPQCEDRAQVGLFLFCFEAQDRGATSSQNVLLSTPSAYNFDGAQPTDQAVPPRVNPSCLFVQSLEPAPNPSPSVSVCSDALCQGALSSCTGDCCGCCGSASCGCALTQPCCPRVYASLLQLNRFTARAVNQNPGWGLNFSLTFPCTPDTAATDNCLSPSVRAAWQAALIQTPFLAPIKYGCRGADYDSCVSDPSAPSDATTQVVWDLKRASCCATAGFRAGQCSTCSGNPYTQTIVRTCSALDPADRGRAVATSQCTPGLEDCQIGCPAQVGTPSKPIKVCVQAVQLVPSTLDVGLWIKSYGSPPTNNSCLVCFMLTPQTKPAFLEGYSDAAPGPPGQGVWQVAVGKTLSLTLVASDSSGDQADIVLLPSPGAPNGAVLSPQALYSAGGLSSTLRTFSFTPLPGQVGLQFTVSFQPRSRLTLTNAGERRDYTIQVTTTQVQWSVAAADGGCPWPLVGGQCLPQGTQPATVGCAYTYRVTASLGCALIPFLTGCSYTSSYNLSLRMQALPACDGCGDAPAAVRACDDPAAAAAAAAGAGAGASGCCGDGACNGYETGSNCPQDCPADGFEVPPCVPGAACAADTAGPGGCCSQPFWRPTQITPGTVSTNFVPQAFSAVLVWTPGRQHQGRRVLSCVEAYDQGGLGAAAVRQARQGPSAPSLCVVFDVASCRYCVPYKSTLRSVARHYLRNADWLRLYNSNPAVPDPAGLLAAQSIHLGPVYTVKSGDTLLGIAAEMRTTVKLLLENNPAVPAGGLIYAGQRLCVLVCSAAPG